MGSLDLVEESARLAALHRLDLLDTAREERFDRVVRIAQRVFDVPVVAVNLVDADRVEQVADRPRLRRDAARPEFCSETMWGREPLVVEDARLDTRFASYPNVTCDPGIRFYAGAPLATPDGHPVGSLCIVDHEPRTLSAEQLELLQDLAAWVEKELARDQELAQAAELLRLMQPRQAPSLPGFTLAGNCLSAREVGGDFYDWYALSDSTQQFLLGDVMGKGVPAALIASSVRAVLRGASRFNPLGEAVTRTAYSLDWDLDETGTFVTLFCARLDPATAVVEYVDAGHGLAVVVDGYGGHRQLVSDGLPLGALPRDRWEARSTVLAPGESLVVASDGFLDLFGGLSECLDALQKARADTTGAAPLVSRLTADALAVGVPDDDLTLVVLHREDDR